MASHHPAMTPKMRTLQRATEVVGGEQKLAEILRVQIDDLSGWLAGTGTPDDKIYLAALDIVARGPTRH
jgi:hypothetical protein